MKVSIRRKCVLATMIALVIFYAMISDMLRTNQIEEKIEDEILRSKEFDDHLRQKIEEIEEHHRKESL